MPNTNNFLQELNHRVKNNFQIIVRLINLKKRLLPIDHREDVRFIEEYVEAMAVAYRLIYATGTHQTATGLLVGELVTALRDIAELPTRQILVEGMDLAAPIDLDRAIALSLYLAASLPPYLDRAATTGGHVLVRADRDEDVVTLSITDDTASPPHFDALRLRLIEIYSEQPRGLIVVPSNSAMTRIRFDVDHGSEATGAFA